MTDQLSKFDRQQIHISGLEAVLSKRNSMIKHLEAQLKSDLKATETKKAYDKGYREGWKACSGSLMEFTRHTSKALEDLNKTAFNKWLEGDKL